ncbi:tetratricopeptide repeat protein [Neptunitalea lumnitzerae]|uniref:Tetratricopeptide repeat protein n=1 Tax=Neptunitalea lumnitzerae TaxID=2965509 RepID=A0ABQ5MJR2_9FLAO|nr:tetratricopeptide repeat protein [Neptunitalea sp. Y10]GLB49634.1 hypothetical protein Y10_20020 [Neptunitalea sp. Y10]
MKNRLIYIIAIVLMAVATSCVENPNVTEDVYIQNPNAVKSWVVGLQRQLALTTNTVNINVAITSDNYFNNYSQYSKVFDMLQIDYFDTDVNNIQGDVQALREMAIYGIETVFPSDEDGTNEDLAFMYFCLGYSNILGGELFTGLPATTLGEVLDSEQTLMLAIDQLDEALSYESDAQLMATYHLLKARVYYDLGDASNAIIEANQALSVPELLFQVEFDGTNALANEMQNATFDALPNRLAPLPRLDFLDPKYYSVGTISTDQKSVTLVKAEEAYLILAEAALANNNISNAKNYLLDLLNLVNARSTAFVDDSGETRNGGVRTDYPLTAVQVRFDAMSEFRDGFVLDRQAGDVVVHTISGTSVNATMINNTTTVEEVLYLTYLMRQEIFMSEGRRLTDLGIKYPISQTEQDNNPNVSDAFTTAQIPSYIPVDDIDDFTVDANGNVTMSVDMNRVIIENRATTTTVPFF